MISAVPPPPELVLLLYQSQTAVHPSPVITAGTSEEEVEQQPLFGQSKMLMQEGADSVVFHILHSFKTFEK